MRKLSLLLLVVLCAGTVRAQSGVGITLTANEIQCVAKIGPNTVNLDEWFWGDQEGTILGKLAEADTQMQLVSVTKISDGCTASMLSAYVKRLKFGSVTISQSKSIKGVPQVVATVVLNDSYLSSYHVSAATTDSGLPAETWTLSFGSICITSRKENPDGTLGDPISFCL
jgi:Type VI secretion system effector, Hcp